MQTETLLVHLRHIPDYLSAQWSAHMGICIIICAVYLFSLFMTGNTGKLLRKSMITFLIVYILYGVFLQSNKFGYQIILIGLIALIAMGIIRFIINTVSEAHQSRIDAKIEEKALATAEVRRGSFKSNAGVVHSYPLKPDPAETDPAQEDSQDSIESQIKAAKAQVIQDETAESSELLHVNSGTATGYDLIYDSVIPKDTSYTGPKFDTPAYNVSDESSTNTQVVPPAEQIEAIYYALNKLGELRDMGILTEEEFTQKKQELLAKL